jgi:hypothetical protein
MEDEERSPEELSEDQPTRGLVFPPFNLGKTWRGPEEALDRFNAEVDEIADKYPDIMDGYTTVRGNQLRIVDYRPRRFDGEDYPNRHGDRKGWKKTPRQVSYQESQQDQQERS